MTPSPLDIALLVAAALAGGTVDAIAGGGGLITVPALLAVGCPPHVALGTNKAQSVCGTAMALTTFWRARQLTPRRARWTFPLGLVGSFAGALAVHAIAPDHLRPVVIALLLCAAGLLLLRKPRRDADEPTPRAFGWALVLAVVIGAYDGFFGPGTGTFLIVGMVLCGASLSRATADAKVVNFASNLAALAVFASRGHVAWALALPMAGAQVAGGLIGARVAIRGGAGVIRVVVVVVSLSLVGKLVYELWA